MQTSLYQPGNSIIVQIGDDEIGKSMHLFTCLKEFDFVQLFQEKRSIELTTKQFLEFLITEGYVKEVAINVITIDGKPDWETAYNSWVFPSVVKMVSEL